MKISKWEIALAVASPFLVLFFDYWYATTIAQPMTLGVEYPRYVVTHK